MSDCMQVYGRADRAKHTPGPWHIDRRADCQAIVSDSSYIVFIPDHKEFDGYPCGSVTSQDKQQPEIDANGHLIAAAPDMLAAIEEAIAHLQHPNGVFADSAVCVLNNALAKALGDEYHG